MLTFVTLSLLGELCKVDGIFARHLVATGERASELERELVVVGQHVSRGGRTREGTYVVRVDEGDEGNEKGVVGLIEGGLVLDGDKLTRVGRSLLLIRMRLHHLRPKTLCPGQESNGPSHHPHPSIYPSI